MGFKEMVIADNRNVFLDPDFFGEYRTVKYDGDEYEEIPCLITKLKEKDRVTPMSDHEHNIYRVTAIFHCGLSDLGGKEPEHGRKFGIYDPDDRFLQEYYVAQSSCAHGMIRLELSAFDE